MAAVGTLPELGKEESNVIKALTQRLRQEIQIGGDRPLWSILHILVDMRTDQIISCIESYNATLSQPTKAFKGKGAEKAKGRGESTYDSYKGKGEGKSGKTDRHAVVDEGGWSKPESWSYTDEAADWGAEQVLEECRAMLEECEDYTLLLSKLGAGISYDARSYLDSRGVKLSRVLAGFPKEFHLHKSGDGRESVTYKPKPGVEKPSNWLARGKSWQHEEWDWSESKWPEGGAATDDLGQVGPKLYVGNLSTYTTEEELMEVFKTYGQVKDVKLMQNRSKTTRQACALIVFSRTAEARSCVEAMQVGYEMRPGEGSIIVKYASQNEGAYAGSTRGTGHLYYQ